jgi:hypothetical protein
MPYGRTSSDAIIQPNGKICLFNGWRYGFQGGQIGVPIGYGAATGEQALFIVLFDSLF